MNPVLILTHNNLELNLRCVTSILEQDIKTGTWIVDNGSTDGTWEWASDFTQSLNTHTKDTCPIAIAYPMGANEGVSKGWNFGLNAVFRKYVSEWNSDHCLVVGSDTVLAPCVYRTLLEASRAHNLPFVTGVAVDSMEQAMQTPDVTPITYNPDFSCFLITRECWEKVGPFDERMKHYSSDQDFHIRAHRLGVRLCKASVPYYHERSSTIRLAPPAERAEIEAQANKDRAVLREKWGVSAGGPDYEALFSPATFGCEAKEVVR